ncbi:hypothetical protein BGZ82_002617 [Podila clonocystis]|nr:hypothetical protein BGZ82_002617 [Podila clonocystis]
MPKINKNFHKDSLVRMNKRYFKSAACEHIRSNQVYAVGKVLEVKATHYVVDFENDPCHSLEVGKGHVSIVPSAPSWPQPAAPAVNLDVDFNELPLDVLDSDEGETEPLEAINQDNFRLDNLEDDDSPGDLPDDISELPNESAPIITGPTVIPAILEWDWKPDAIIKDVRSPHHSWHMINEDKGHLIDPTLLTTSPRQLFVAFLPKEFLESVMIPAINQNLSKAHKNQHVPLDFAEFIYGSEGMPGVRNMPAKPHPVGQEYKTLADPATNILLQLNLAQHKEAAP